MPHCVMEHFGAFAGEADRDETMQLALDLCCSTGTITRENLKVRCVAADAILSGDGRSSFVHVTLSMLAGRTPQQKVELAETLREGLRGRLGTVESISVDIRDMDPDCYRKSLV